MRDCRLYRPNVITGSVARPGDATYMPLEAVARKSTGELAVRLNAQAIALEPD
jgi:hypothetical protein